jgi:hypothetical protein
MSRVRFATANDLFETFPELFKTIKVPPNDKFPLDFLKDLSVQGKLDDAVTFCAYLLPRREAVWWACVSVRALSGSALDKRAAGLLVAEAWVQQPENDRRLAALDTANAGDPNDPTTYLAFAAGRSGGLLFPHPETPVSMPAGMTPQAARTAILLAAHYADPAKKPALLQTCIEDGANLATDGL